MATSGSREIIAEIGRKEATSDEDSGEVTQENADEDEGHMCCPVEEGGRMGWKGLSD